jgi:PKD repeat protein
MNYLFTNLKRMVFLCGILTLLTTIAFAQRGNQTVISDKNAPREFLNETNKEELLTISSDLEKQWISRRKNVEEFARKANIKIRQELPNNKVMQLVEVEDGSPWFYITNNTGAANTTRASQFWGGGSLGLNLDGSSLPPIGVWDAGAVLADHQEFTNGGCSRITQKDGATSVSNHATHVTGTLIANGVTSKAKGMTPNAQVYAYDWSNDASEMAAAAAEGMLISSHSYGYTYGWSGNTWYGNTNISTQEDYRFGFYSTYSRNWDNISYNAPYYLIVKSAGNDRNEGPADGAHPKDGNPNGFDCIGTDAIGKNILTVGSVSQVINCTQPSEVVMSSNSGWGPADDGRIKPDVVGKGVLVYSTTGSSATGYATMSGTSMATPNVAGTLALLQEYYLQVNGTPMRSATLKALTIHTADEAGPAPGPDYMFGWGLVNAERAAKLISENQISNINIQELCLANGGTFQLNVKSNGFEPLKATIVWTDPAGKALAPALNPETPALVHDLDLLISGNNQNFFPWKLDKNNPSSPASRNSKNFVDNVEVVLIDSPVAGEYTINVTHDGSLTAAQNFSLIISGATKVNSVAPLADFSANASSVTIGEYVQFNNQSINNPTSFKWEFAGCEPLSCTEENPKVKFTKEGSFSVKLTATNGSGSDTKTKTNYITVKPLSVQADFSASKTFVTEGESISFTDISSNNPTSWLWTFAGGTPSTSTSKNPTVIYNVPGVYDVTLKVSNANGTDQQEKTGYIAVAMKAPVAGFTASSTEILTGSTVQFTDKSQNAQTYAWTFEGGTPATSNLKSPSVTYNTSGTFTVTQKVSNTSGNDTQTVTSMITVKAPSVSADFTATTTSVVEGGSVSFSDLSSNNPTSWLWTFAGGTPSTSTSKNPTVIYNVPGVYDVTLKASNANGTDQQEKTGYIAVAMKAPVAGFTASSTEVLTGSTVLFTDKSQNAQTYAWTFEGGTPATSNLKNPSVTYNTSGTFTVTQKVSNTSGNDTQTVTSMITVKAPSVSADFTATTTSVVEGGSVSFSDLSSNNPTSWLWTFAGGTPATSTSKNPTVIYNVPGVYDVTLKVSNANGTDQQEKTGYIAVAMKAPVAGFTASVTEIFVGESVQFADQSQNAQTFAWTFEGGTPATSTAMNPLVTYNTAGTYTVSQRVTNSTESDTKTVISMITVKAPAVGADFTASSTSVVEGGSVSFTDISANNPTSWLWTFNGGTPATSAAQNPTVTYNAPGVYDVTLQVSNGYSTHQIVKSGYIAVAMKAPVAGFTASATGITTGGTVQFTDQSQNAQSYAWTFEGGTPATSNDKNPLVTYNNSGSFNVKLTVSNASGSDDITYENILKLRIHRKVILWL